LDQRARRPLWHTYNATLERRNNNNSCCLPHETEVFPILNQPSSMNCDRTYFI